MKIVSSAILLFVSLATKINAQQAGTLEQEGHPTITLKECTLADGCSSTKAKLTLDANWRWVHHKDGYTNCYTGDQWNSQYCSDPVACARDCALEGVSADKYRSTYGVEQLQDGVRLKFVSDHAYGTNVGSRLYVMDGDDKYKMFQLKNREFSMDINVSELYCGMNGAMYFVEMDAYGGKGLGNNQAGAKYGTGYCDAQCPHDIKFISGEANSVDWRPNPKDKSNNMGIGKYGSCCAEMDIWEANSMATAYTPHPCDLGDEKPAQYRCDGIDCGDNDKGERYQGVCDKDGCDINPYRMGNPSFYGRGPEFAVDTTKKITLVTQFLTTDGTDTGDLSEIKRFYIQDGERIDSPSSTILGPYDSDSITDDFCIAKKNLFGDVNDFNEKGGNKAMGESLDRGQVLAISLWDDVEVNMLWLDSAYPLDKSKSEPGVMRGECPGGESSTPTYLRDNFPNSSVTFENAAIGEIGSTQLSSKSTNSPTSAPNKQASCGCGPADNKNQPECNDQTESRCKQMMQYEGKCKWTECSTMVPSSSPIANPTKYPTKSPTESPTTTNTKAPTPGCYSNNYKNCNHPAYDSESCNMIWLPNGARNDCVALWGDCSDDANSCCEPATCLSNGGYGQCVPRLDTTEPSISPSAGCADDPAFFHRDDTSKTCTWIGQNSDRKSRLCAKDEVKEGCPATCGECTEPSISPSAGCADDLAFFHRDDTNKTCTWIGQNSDRKSRLCAKDVVKEGCPATCGECS